MKPKRQKPLIRRTTGMTDALVAACENAGIDTTSAKLPLKREPTWTVTRKG